MTTSRPPVPALRPFIIKRAAEAGATVEIEPADQFYGERSGSFKDPFGHRWNIGHSIEEVTPRGDAETLHGDDGGGAAVGRVSPSVDARPGYA